MLLKGVRPIAAHDSVWNSVFGARVALKGRIKERFWGKPPRKVK